MSEYSTLGRYEIISELGHGGMGTVLLGRDPRIDRKVALKVIQHKNFADPDHEEETIKRFHQEAKAAGKLSHPNIVTVFDVGDEDDVSYIAMEYVQGRDLSEIIKERGRLSFQEATSVIVQVAMALSYSHDHGIIHRDIKPGNIMIDKDGVVKITDFGLARLQEAESITKAGHTVGSPLYMSPEQLQSGDIDYRSDIFSMGVVYYELLTGVRPFQGENISELIDQIIDEEPLSVTTLAPDLPPRVNTILGRMLAKSPRGRYQTAGAAARDVRNLQALPDPFKTMTESDARLTTHYPGELTPLQPFKKKVRPSPPTLQRLALAVLLGVLAGLVGLLTLGGESDRALRAKDTLTKVVDGVKDRITPAAPAPETTPITPEAPSAPLPVKAPPPQAPIFGPLSEDTPSETKPGANQEPAPTEPAPQPKLLPLAPPEIKPGMIFLRSDVVGNALIDGVDAGKTPIADYPVEKGKHTLEIKAEGYQPWVRIVQVVGGETLDFEASLTLAEGAMLVVSDPPGAQVFIDDQPKGDTPLVVTGLELGVHKIRLSKEGYFPFTESARLQKGSGEKVSGVLSQGARLVVAVPEGAQVLIDGKATGKGSVDTILTEGSHEVVVSQEGYNTETRSVQTSVGKETRLDVVLERKGYGSLRISAAPWANIYINGRKFGTTPRTITRIKTGYVTVKLVNPGYQPYVVQILIEPGQRARVAHTFMDEEAISAPPKRDSAAENRKNE